MLKNMTRKVSAIGAAAALALVGLVPPAGAVTANPAVGDNLYSRYGSPTEMVGVAGHAFSLKFSGTVAGTTASDAAAKLAEYRTQIETEILPAAGKTAPTIVETIDATADFAIPTANSNVQVVLEVDNDAAAAATASTAAGNIVIVAPDLDYNLEMRIRILYDNGTLSEWETITFLKKTSVTASLALDSFQTGVASTTVDAYWSLSGVNTANVVVSNFAYSGDATPAAGEIGVALSAGTDATLTTVQSNSTYDVVTDRYKVVLTDTGGNGFAAGDEIELFLHIGASTNANVYFNANATAASTKRVVSAAGSYDGMTIDVAQSKAVKHNDTATATSFIEAETVAVLEETKTLNFTISLFDDFGLATQVAAGANHEVTVTLTDTANGLGSTTITSEGRTLKMSDVNSSISFTKKTNSVGQIAFAVTADKALDGESFTITATGTISGVSIDPTSVAWQEAKWTVLPAVDGNFTIAPKGSLALDYTVADQFGNFANADYQLAVTRAAGAGSRDTVAEYANWSYVAPVSATGKASFTIVDNGAAVEGSDTVTVALQKKASAGGAYVAATPSVSDTFTLTYENDMSALSSAVKVSYDGIANSAGTAVLPIYIESDPLVDFDQRISNDRTAVNKWEAFNVEADGVKANDADVADALLRVYGTVLTTNNAPVAGVAVRISGAGLNFADKSSSITRASNDSFVVFTDSTGSYEAFVRSSVAGRQTISIDAQGAKSSVVVRFQESTGVASKLTLDGPSTVAAGARADFVAKVVDKFGKAVSGITVSFKDNGPGVLSATSANTDPFGDASVTLTTLAAESGTTTVTAWASIGGETVSVTKTITVGAVAAELAAKIGSFNGRVAVRVENAKGSTVSVKVGNRWYKYTAVNDNYLWSVRSVKGRSVSVSVYVDAELQNVQTITVR